MWASVRECHPSEAVAPQPLLRSALIRRLAVVCKGAQMLSRMAAELDLVLDVLLRERSQEGDQHPQSNEDVDDREDSRVIAGRGEVP
jgi:hypothetical protein